MVATYTSRYPAQDATHVKATSSLSANYVPYNATDPAKSLTGDQVSNEWLSNSANTNQRFHIDLGSRYVIKRIYFENDHYYGGSTITGIKNFTFWGSNTDSSFLELTYGTDTGWTQLTTDITQLSQHTASDVSDPQFALVTNLTAYRYYALKIADNWGGSYMGIRRIVLQTEDAAGWSHIAKVNGAPSSSITKMNNIAIANIAKVNGVAI